MNSGEIRQQVINDMKMAGLAVKTREQYLGMIERFFAKVWVAPEQVTEAMVRDYLNARIERGVTAGTLKPMRYALAFLFQETLGRDWGLFKKESPRRVGSVCRNR